MSELRFTEELKQEWLKALKSGDYKRGTNYLKQGEGDNVRHCFLGVLGAICPKIDEYEMAGPNDAYDFIDKRHDIHKRNLITDANDSVSEEESDGYEMVIPLIEALEVSKPIES